MLPNTKRKSRLNAFLLGLFVMLLLCRCSTRDEGCLDAAAANFDLSADRACDDCCEYPPISILLSQKWNDLNFMTDTTWSDINSSPYRIIDLKYLLSSFSWINIEEEVFTIDSSEIACGQQTVRFTSDIVQVDTKKFTYLLDSIREFPLIKALRFKVGWVPELECIDESSDEIPVVLRDNSPLWDSLLSARAAIRIILQRDTTMNFFDTLYIHTCEDIPLTYDYEFILGTNTVLPVTVNYAIWFADADVADANSFRASVLAHLKDSFFKTQ